MAAILQTDFIVLLLGPLALNKTGHMEFMKIHRRDSSLAVLTGVFLSLHVSMDYFLNPKSLYWQS